MHIANDRGIPAVEDLVGVKSRISWPAIFGGAVIAVAFYLVLTFLCAAVGLTLTETNLRGETIAIGAVVAAVIAMAAALFLGGWVTAQLSVGENLREAIIHGVLTWAVVMAVSLCLIGAGIRGGYMALMGTAVVAQNDPQVQQKNWEELARDAKVPQEKIDEAKRAIDPNRVQAELNDPANQTRAKRISLTAAWALFAGTLVGIGATVGGAVVGRGESFRLLRPVAAITVERREILRQ